MATVTVETAKFILDNIDKSTKRLSDLNNLIENYKFQISNVGKNSSLGQTFTRDLNLLKGEKNNLVYRIEELKQCIADFDMSLLSATEKNKTKDVEAEAENIDIKEESIKEEENIKKSVQQTNVENEQPDIIEEEELENDNSEIVQEITSKTKVKENVKENNESDCDYYKISSVAAFIDGKIMDAFLIESDEEISNKISQLYYDYGNNIEIMFNYDGYRNSEEKPIHENMGWININDLNFSTGYKREIKSNDSNIKTEEVKEKVQVAPQEKVETNLDEDYLFENLEEDNKIYNFKVVYRKGKYRVDFDIIEDGDVIHQTYENKLSLKALYSKYTKKKIAKKYGIDQNSKLCKNMDVNLLNSLEEIDQEYGTKYAYDYVNGILNIKLKYNLKDMYSNKSLKLQDKIIQRKIALKQKKIANADVEGAYYSKGVVGALSAFVLLATMGISSILPSFGKKDSNTETKTKNNIEHEISDNNVTEEINTTEIVENIINTKQKENAGLGINDSLQLIVRDKEGNIKSTYKLSKDLNKNSSEVLASDYSDCTKFKISAIAIYKDGEQLDIINSKDDDIRTNELYDKYGDDVEIIFNFDAYKNDKTIPEYKSIGWLSISDFKDKESSKKVKDIASAQEEIRKENEANNIVEKEASKDDTVSTGENSNVEAKYYDFGLEGKIMLAFKDNNGDVVSSQKISSDAWGNGKQIDAAKIECDYFKISCIAVYNGSNILDVKAIKDGESVDDITNSMYQEYGADIDIAYNFNGYNNDKDEALYKYVGWLNLDKLVNITDDEKVAASKVNTSINGKTLIKK